MQASSEFRRSADVVIIGGGVIGLAISRELSMRGLNVTIVERGKAGAECSQAAAGMLAPQAEANAPNEFFRLASASRDMYPRFAEALCEETGIDIELDLTGTLYLALTGKDEQELRERFAWQKRAGLAVEMLSSAEARTLEPNVTPFARLALRFPFDGQVENRRLIAALVASTEARGVSLLTETEVTSITVERGRVRGVETSRGAINAPVVVAASGAWTSLLPVTNQFAWSERGGDSHPRIEPVRGQMMCLESGAPFVRHVVYSPRGYLVPRRDNRLLVGATTERVGFDQSVTASGVQAVLTHGSEIAPRIGELRFKEAWAGLRPHAPADGLPVIGHSSEIENLYYATGHYRNGILLAPLTGRLMADAIVSRAVSPMLARFTPERFVKVYERHQKIN